MTTNETNEMSETGGRPVGFPLRRPYEGRIVAGVAAGVADYLDVDVSIVRIGIVVLTLLGGMGVPAYLAAWLLIPDEGSPESVAEEWLHRFQDHQQYHRYGPHGPYDQQERAA